MKSSFVESAEKLYRIREFKGSAVTYSIALPSPMLREYINSYYQAEVNLTNNTSPNINVRSVLLPLDSVEMIFCYHDSSVLFRNKIKKSKAFCNIIGQHNLISKCEVTDISKVNKTFYIRFQPGGFYKLFGVRQDAVKNDFFNAHEFLNSEGKNLEDKINNSNSFLERIKIIESYFIKKITLQSAYRKSGYETSKIQDINKALFILDKFKGAARVGDLAKRINVAERTLRWHFANIIGVSPKEYIALKRFKNIIIRLSGEGNINWNDLILSNGYYDQSHLINDFKSVTGITPSSFIKDYGKTHIKCTNKIFFIEPSYINPLKQYSSDLMHAEKISK